MGLSPAHQAGGLRLYSRVAIIMAPAIVIEINILRSVSSFLRMILLTLL
jgi:hypothetical protein